MQKVFKSLPSNTAPDLLGLSGLCILFTCVRFYYGEYTKDNSIVFSCGKSLYLTGNIENTYWYHFMDTFNFPCFSWYLQLPFFYLIPEKHHLTLIFIIPAFYLLLSLWIMYHLYGPNTNRYALLLLGLVLITSGILNSLRFEVMCMPLLLCLPRVIAMESSYRFLISGVVLGIIGNIHPAPMLIGLLLCLFYEFEKRKTLPLRMLFKYVVYASTCALLFYLPLIIKNYSDWLYNIYVLGVIKDRHYFNPLAIYSVAKLLLPFTPLLLSIVLLRHVVFTTRQRTYLLCLIFLISIIIGRPLYFIYSLPFMVYCISRSAENFRISKLYLFSTGMVFIGSLLFGPTMFRLRSSDAIKAKRVIHETINRFHINENSTLWIAPKYGLYSRYYEQTKAFGGFLVRFIKKPYPLKSGDVVILTSTSDMRCFSKFFYISPEVTLVRKRIINPIPLIGIKTKPVDSLMLETVFVQ